MRETEAPTFLVLLAEDDPGDAKLVRTAFGEGPYSCLVEHVWDGVEAVGVLDRAVDGHGRIPDLLMLDINMPRKTGLEVLAEVKANTVLNDIPVVMLSTSEAERDVTAAYKAGAAGYIAKPVEVDDLFSAIHGIADYWFGVTLRPR